MDVVPKGSDVADAEQAGAPVDRKECVVTLQAMGRYLVALSASGTGVQGLM
jgi:hypothetical protein